MGINSKEPSKKAIKFALECRLVRLFIAKNPHATELDIKTGLKMKSVGYHLAKMVNMGIIIRAGNESHGGWTVVPQ